MPDQGALRIAPYGRWPSPLRAEDAAAGKVSLSELCSDGSSLYWLESRPAEGGRVVFVRWDGQVGGLVVEVSPHGVSIRSRVHEYGGGAVCLVPGHSPGAFVYVDLSDQRVWFAAAAGAPPVPLTEEPPQGEQWYHGGLGTSADGRWVVAVREAHTKNGRLPVRSVMAFRIRSESEPISASVLLSEHDFYGAPALHPDGTRVAVVTWDHPDMPWDFSRVHVCGLATVTDAITGPRRLEPSGVPWSVSDAPGDGAGAGRPSVSVGQPTWRRDGRLLFVSDRRGWWQPYEHDGPEGAAGRRLSATAAEFHGADFVLGLRTMAELGDGTIVAVATSRGRDRLVVLGGEEERPLEQPCVEISSVCAHGNGVAFIGTTPDAPSTVWLMPHMGAPAHAVRRPQSPALAPDDVSIGEGFSLVGRSGRPVYGVYFAPHLSSTTGPEAALPPLVVQCHSGPTSRARPGFDMTVQYFTSRGFAVAAVNYAGSTGYGRDYRCSLWGQWGQADSEDCEDAALFLAERGVVDRHRLVIRGNSAGGLTALNALVTDSGDGDDHDSDHDSDVTPTFRAAATWYGVTDLVGLAASTHDFEAHYLDRLVGPLPEARSRYDERSPVNRGQAMHGSVLLLQGMDDPVVPPAQAEHLQQALRAAGRRCEARFFPGEGHGFRQQVTLVACLEAELAFFQEELQL
jgi:dipeptidyl aminopeptidase/acylaminoacyl peptidase